MCACVHECVSLCICSMQRPASDRECSAMPCFILRHSLPIKPGSGWGVSSSQSSASLLYLPTQCWSYRNALRHACTFVWLLEFEFRSLHLKTLLHPGPSPKPIAQIVCKGESSTHCSQRDYKGRSSHIISLVTWLCNSDIIDHGVLGSARQTPGFMDKTFMVIVSMFCYSYHGYRH